MKYLNRYNEELKSSTYKSAADKFTKLGHTKRAAQLMQHHEKSLLREEIETWKKQVETYSKYGTIKVVIENKSLGTNSEEEFYFCFYPWLDSYRAETAKLVRGDQGDDWEIYTDIYLEMWLIPKTEEQLYRVKEELEPEHFTGLGFQTNTLRIDLKLEPNNFDINEHNFYYNDGEFPSYITIKIADRPSAGRVKILLKKFFSDSSIEYPVPDWFSEKYKTMYRTLSSIILAEPGVSSECGLSMHDFADYIGTISPNKFWSE
jgi:hypothetical protein